MTSNRILITRANGLYTQRFEFESYEQGHISSMLKLFPPCMTQFNCRITGKNNFGPLQILCWKICTITYTAIILWMNRSPICIMWLALCFEIIIRFVSSSAELHPWAFCVHEPWKKLILFFVEWKTRENNSSLSEKLKDCCSSWPLLPRNLRSKDNCFTWKLFSVDKNHAKTVLVLTINYRLFSLSLKAEFILSFPF